MDSLLQVTQDGDRTHLGSFISLKGNAPGQDYARNRVCLDDQRTCVNVESVSNLSAVFPTR